MSKKRVLIFSLGYYPYIGGAEVAIKEITDRIPHDEAEFDMITLRFTSSQKTHERVGNVNVYRVGLAARDLESVERLPIRVKFSKLFFPFVAFWKARSLHKKQPYDLTWVNMANHGAFAALFFKWVYPQTEYVLMLQNGQTVDQVMRKNKILKILYPQYKKIYTRADRIQAISHFTKNLAESMGATCPINIVSNGVNVQHFSQHIDTADLEALKHSLNLSRDKKYIITTSRLVMHRGVEDLIRSLTFLPEDVELLVLGQGEDREKLERLAQTLNVSERVHFFGHIEHTELPKYLHCADVFVRPSIHEGFGNSFIEAMVAGIPVVATPVGGIPDFLYDPDTNPEEPSTGLFCEVRNPQSVAEQVQRLLSDDSLRESIVENARALVTARYDWNIITDRMKREVFMLDT